MRLVEGLRLVGGVEGWRLELRLVQGLWLVGGVEGWRLVEGLCSMHINTEILNTLSVAPFSA